MVDFARYFLDFAQKESCGACVPCRLGTKQLLDILEDITAGKGKAQDIDLLMELAEGVKVGSLCGLGQTAPNPVLTTIRYFRDEYEAHVHPGKCPAGNCRALIEFTILSQECNGCGLCLRACPLGDISGEKKQPHSINPLICDRCGICRETCRFNAVTLVQEDEKCQKSSP